MDFDVNWTTVGLSILGSLFGGGGVAAGQRRRISMKAGGARMTTKMIRTM